MTNTKWWSRAYLVVLALGIGSAVGGCVVAPAEPAPDEPAAAVIEGESTSELSGPASLQIVFQCFTPGETPIGTPKSTLDGCRAACAAPNMCVRCTFQNNAIECL